MNNRCKQPNEKVKYKNEEIQYFQLPKHRRTFDKTAAHAAEKPPTLSPKQQRMDKKQWTVNNK